jgi:hypothetical protein
MTRQDKFWGLLVYTSCACMCLGLGLAGLVGQPPTAHRPPPRAPLAQPVPDRQDFDTARANREAIENGLLGGGTVQLDNGTYFLDRSVKLDQRHSRGTLRGRGVGTVLRNQYTASPYLDNCTLVAYPEATAYVEPFDGLEEDSVHIPETYPWLAGVPVDLSQFREGEVCYALTWNGQWYDDKMEYSRLVISKVDRAARRVYFEQGVPSGTEDMLKWVHGRAVHDVKEGDAFVTPVKESDLDQYRRGMDVYVTSGPEFGMEVTGEFRKVTGKEGKKLLLDRPVGRSYAKASCLLGPWLADFNLEDLALDNPVNLASNPLVLKFAVRCTLRRVACGDCVSIAFGTAGYLNIHDVDAPGFGGMGINACHDVNVRNCRVAGVNFEESCTKVSVADTLVMTVNGVHGVQGHVNCSQIEIRNCRVEGFGYDRGWGNGSPFSMGGRDCRVIDTVVRNSNPVTGSYLWGDNFQIRGLDSDVGVLMPSGSGWRVANSRAPYWWPFPTTGGGRYTSVDGEKRGKVWEGDEREQADKEKVRKPSDAAARIKAYKELEEFALDRIKQGDPVAVRELLQLRAGRFHLGGDK